ncbi:serine/threonine protein kinase [Nitzschia inconspicua]|uniref:non-specific serine/threonine protein kinase n=1 Tax=Nitzschia inconspicua TaxID=303405 RepID=A0A9K3QAG0_9STRA|nr:serine/threonine protein kinase [Nitzschia inconspicua]
MKLDPTVMRTMNPQDFRVLEACEKGMQKGHALVPSALIASLATLRHGGTGKILSSLLRDKLLSHDQSCGYDGYRVTQAGYDILALWSLKQRKIIAAIGDKIGTGKESDIYLAVQPNGQQVVLKFHRLGRTSFRNVKKTRDYFVYQQSKGGRRGHTGVSSQNQANSWLFLSKQSAVKEFAFMKALWNVDYPTPTPLGHSRHVVCMSLIRGVPLYQVQSRHLSSEQAASIFRQAADLAVRLAQHGLVHCDLNEFNLMVDLSGIQQTALSNEHDTYVRHSGMSVAAESTPGMLSARGPWEPDHLQQFQPDQQQDVGSVQEEPPTPMELLDNGEPKPIVTLIDFPQMVSTLHPNAKDLYERDTQCLLKFFTHKLQFQIPESEQSSLYLTWESVLELIQEQQQHQQQQQQRQIPMVRDDCDNDEEASVSTASVMLASKAQLRLDQQLKASGYSQEDVQRDLELYYYREKDEDEDDDDNNDDDDNDEGDDYLRKDDDGDGNDSVSGSIASNEEDEEKLHSNENPSSGASVVSILPSSALTDLSRQELQEHARERVQQQLELKKRQDRQRGAFRKRNSNKSYLKGKRVFQDVVPI